MEPEGVACNEMCVKQFHCFNYLKIQMAEYKSHSPPKAIIAAGQGNLDPVTDYSDFFSFNMLKQIDLYVYIFHALKVCL